MQNKDNDLSFYRFSLARETLKNARLCLENHFFRDCINRSYYAVFYAVKAVLAMESVDFKRHKDAIAYFNKTYVAADIFPKELGKRIGRIKMMREESDYSDFFIVSEEDARKQFETAEYTLKLVEEYINSQSTENEDVSEEISIVQDEVESDVEIGEIQEENLAETKVTEEPDKVAQNVVEKTVVQVESKEAEENAEDTQALNDHNVELQEAELVEEK